MTSTTQERPVADKKSAAEQNVLREGPGCLLREGREKKEMTPMEAASRLNISVQQLNALEADDFANLPAPIFVRNFLTRYAELLELDAKELIRMYESVGEQNQPTLARVSLRQSINSSNVSVRWVTYALIGMVVALMLIWATSLGVSNLWHKEPVSSTDVPASGPVVNEIALPELSPEDGNIEDQGDLPAAE